MTIDRETIEALRAEPELLAIADAVQSAGDQLGPVPAPRSRRRPVRIAAVAVAAAAVVGILLSSPWQSGGPSFVDKALAAVGNRPVLHIVAGYTFGDRVDLRTGQTSPIRRYSELWYDTSRDVYRVVARVDGRVVFRQALSGALDSPVLYTTVYRQALKRGKLHIVGHTLVRGHAAIVVESHEGDGSLMRAALDAHSFRLLRAQLITAGHVTFQIDVLLFETVSREQAQLPKHPPPSPRTTWSSGSGSAVTGESALVNARTAFGRRALWPGRFIQGHRLVDEQLETDKSTSRGRTVHGQKLLLSYGPRDRFFDLAYLEIEEAPASSPLWNVASVYAPPDGYLDLTSGQTSSTYGQKERTQWTGVMSKNGFTIQLTSWSRSMLIAAARAMRALP